MADQGKGAPGRAGGVGPTGALTGLADADLRTLRAMDDPELIAAVDRVLSVPDEFQQVWNGEGEDDLAPEDPGEDAFSAQPAESTRSWVSRE
ncbi:hypothetical protein PEM37_22320 [Streptomyces sp. AD681]|uniref:hypothetical protein n=1 Tax=Streptomyces sp. AD681 TaxID=3019069 RepID=UPI0022F18A12|nr:hypothetical protein [Streptomyces sp. AD681]MDA5144252.1 hypothetical protein [Streptomyces sp. AD681]